ncbi:Hypothetical Protein FCC1311_111482 [Hondaea fermentalgiana]|uniref:Uncharacterized protein n=1 Tax=Hondaea fermentalgiana TaxID=2315210 RepID=A0A2R5GWG8_9STRA|nr:Hypothetical Protein FCC1311_111482 [Hondaea fermentalgiana]|eukprot:GBG34925.1 Hypothetical Protein FCC1311_111482 [Hondaea fermentalgiana]
MSSSSSSGDAVAAADENGPAMRAIEAQVEETVSAFMEMNPAADRNAMTWLCRIYFRDADKKGFVYPFDAIWPILGYSTKGNAKRAVTRILEKGGTFGKLCRENDMDVMVYHRGKTNRPTGQGGDRRSENIMLTWSGFSEFCQLSRTPQGDAIRAFTGAMIMGLRQLQKALDSGEVALVRGPNADTESFPEVSLEDAAVVRLESCELTKMLGQKLCLPGKKFDSSFSVVHGTINKMAMGITKAELGDLIQKKLSQFSARDYMTHEQQILARRAMFEACKEPTREAAIARVHTICQNSRNELMLAMHCQPGTVPEKFMTLKRARKTVALIEDRPSPKRSRQLTLL